LSLANQVIFLTPLSVYLNYSYLSFLMIRPYWTMVNIDLHHDFKPFQEGLHYWYHNDWGLQHLEQYGQ